MKLTEERKAEIDSKDYQSLLFGWRFAPVGSPWFQGETGDYWAKRMSELKNELDGDSRHVSTSKSLSWRRSPTMTDTDKAVIERAREVLREHIGWSDRGAYAPIFPGLVRDLIALAERNMREAEACVWTEDGSVWETTCGNAFEFTADGPPENKFTHCPYCGGPLEAHADGGADD